MLNIFAGTTRQRAFSRDTGVETMSAILKEDPPFLSSSPSVLPPGIDRVVRRCLEKNREERFQSASDLALEKTPLERYVPPAKPSLVGLSRAELAEELRSAGVPERQLNMRVF